MWMFQYNVLQSYVFNMSIQSKSIIEYDGIYWDGKSGWNIHTLTVVYMYIGLYQGCIEIKIALCKSEQGK